MSGKIDPSKSFQKWPVATLIRRFIWMLLWPLFKWLPKRLSILRVLVLRCFGASIGRRCLIMPGVKILVPWKLKLGDCVAIGRNVNLYNFVDIYIGSYSVVSEDAFLCTGTHDLAKVDLPLIMKNIFVGNYCWIGARVNILPGVRLAEGTAIGLGGNVVKSIEKSWCIYGGNPAVFIKERLVVQDLKSL